MTTGISEEKRLLIAARQWLQILIDEFDVDPKITEVEVSAASPGGRRHLARVTLADTLVQMEAIGVMATSHEGHPARGV